jgi:hypothetical protein
MARYILVPGACHGGWWYQPVVDALREAGHEADAITLSGSTRTVPRPRPPTSTRTSARSSRCSTQTAARPSWSVTATPAV